MSFALCDLESNLLRFPVLLMIDVLYAGSIGDAKQV